MSIYILDSIYNRAVDQMAKVEPCSVTGKIEPDDFKIILGEVLDIWPASIASDVDAAQPAMTEALEEKKHPRSALRLINRETEGPA